MPKRRSSASVVSISNSEASDYAPRPSSPESSIAAIESDEYDSPPPSHPKRGILSGKKVPAKRKVSNGKGIAGTSRNKKGKQSISKVVDEDIEDVVGDIEDFGPVVQRDHEMRYHDVAGIVQMQSRLLGWFSDVREKRGMPWRKRYDPSLSMEEKGQRAYEIWVSEVMLQQTQVATVIAYWNRWIEKWPTIADLAKADIEEVNAAWRGLGYYRRARSLLAGAKTVMGNAKYNARLPDDPQILEKEVEGVGRYTAGAICSMAYGVRTPIVDGNVHRLLTRLLAVHATQTAPTTIKFLWSAASQLVERLPNLEGNSGIAGDWNQGLMELGSQICKPASPDCAGCPLQSGCKAYAEVNSPLSPLEPAAKVCDLCAPVPSSVQRATLPSVTIFPMRKEKKVSRVEEEAVCVVEWRGESGARRWLFVKRPEKGLLAGLFEPPTTPVPSKATPAEHAAVSLQALTALLRLSSTDLQGMIQSTEEISQILHIFSHINMTYHIQHLILSTPRSTEPPVPVSSTENDGRAVVWLDEAEVEIANVGTGVKKVWAEVYGSWGSFETRREDDILKTKKAKKTNGQTNQKPVGRSSKGRPSEGKILKKIMMPAMPSKGVTVVADITRVDIV